MFAYTYLKCLSLHKMKLRDHLKFLYNGGLDPTTADLSELNVRRTVVVFIFCLIPVTSFLMVTNYFLEARSDNKYIAVGMSVVLFALYLQAYHNRRTLAANMIVFVYWLVIFILLFDYGVVGILIFWVLPIPPMAILLNGVKAGIFWCATCIFTLLFFSFLEINSIYLMEKSVRTAVNLEFPTDSALVFSFDASLILIILTIATIVFKKFQLKAEEKLNQSVKSLQKEVLTRRVAETKAINSERAKSEFFAAMGHELRTPLNGVIGMAQLLKNVEDKSERDEYLNILLDCGETLLELINDVLDLSSIESGKMALETRKIDIGVFLEQVLASFALQAKAKSVEFSHTISRSVPDVIYGDPTRLRQVIINLVGNAMKFTTAGEIKVAIDTHEENLRIRVNDTGIGIDKSIQSKLFEPYVQADAETARIYGGSGLGLAIVSKLCTAMNGSISIESEVGCGSCFTFVVPLLTTHDDSEKYTPARISKIPTLKILIVDDNAVNRLVLTRMLEKDSHNIVTASDGKEAVEIASSLPLNLILMDIKMPIMDGLAACKHIRESDGINARIPIIAISANYSKEDEDVAIAAGMNDYLAKPFRFADVTHKISSSLQLTLPEHQPAQPIAPASSYK